MAREKGTGSLQREKSGRYTIRVGINGKRLSRSTRTTDKDTAERLLNRFLAPLGLGAERLPLAEAWHHYEISPNRRDIAKSTLQAKRNTWMEFARWIEHNHMEMTELAHVTPAAAAEYLAQFRSHHSGNTYTNHACTLREVFRTLGEKSGLAENPFDGVRLRPDDSISRRELTLDEVERLYTAATKRGPEWKLLVMTGIYTGLRLGDCCRLKWEYVNLNRKIIQLVPAKTRSHAQGRPVTIPIHPILEAELAPLAARRAEFVRAGDVVSPYVNVPIADTYNTARWRIDEVLAKIFKAANITMSVRSEGRRRKTVIASFHSLRHTFVSFSANAGVPLPVVQSIVGHCSTAMTRHYYHESEEALRSAVEAIPALGGANALASPPSSPAKQPLKSSKNAELRLKRLDRLFAKGIISEEERSTIRNRILLDL